MPPNPPPPAISIIIIVSRDAQRQAESRRYRGSRLERDPVLRERVLSGLAAGWSPEQVAGRLALEAGHRVISHESIYRFIYAQIARTKDYTCRGGSPGGAIAVGGAAIRCSGRRGGRRCRSATRRPRTAARRGTGRRI